MKLPSVVSVSVYFPEVVNFFAMSVQLAPWFTGNLTREHIPALCPREMKGALRQLETAITRAPQYVLDRLFVNASTTAYARVAVMTAALRRCETAALEAIAQCDALVADMKAARRSAAGGTNSAEAMQRELIVATRQLRQLQPPLEYIAESFGDDGAAYAEAHWLDPVPVSAEAVGVGELQPLHNFTRNDVRDTVSSWVWAFLARYENDAQYRRGVEPFVVIPVDLWFAFPMGLVKPDLPQYLVLREALMVGPSYAIVGTSEGCHICLYSASLHSLLIVLVAAANDNGFPGLHHLTSLGLNITELQGCGRGGVTIPVCYTPTCQLRGLTPELAEADRSDAALVAASREWGTVAATVRMTRPVFASFLGTFGVGCGGC
jgi:hypothetical protein